PPQFDAGNSSTARPASCATTRPRTCSGPSARPTDSISASVSAASGGSTSYVARITPGTLFSEERQLRFSLATQHSQVDLDAANPARFRERARLRLDRLRGEDA